jgi:hypothetical protein
LPPRSSTSPAIAAEVETSPAAVAACPLKAKYEFLPPAAARQFVARLHEDEREARPPPARRRVSSSQQIAALSG